MYLKNNMDGVIKVDGTFLNYFNKIFHFNVHRSGR